RRAEVSDDIARRCILGVRTHALRVEGRDREHTHKLATKQNPFHNESPFGFALKPARVMPPSVGFNLQAQKEWKKWKGVVKFLAFLVLRVAKLGQQPGARQSPVPL